MQTIQVEISDDLLQKAGKEAITVYLQKQIKFLKLKMLGEEIRKSFEESEFNMEKEFQAAREEAWQEYKSQYLKDILK
jgi:1-deoxy-D-xylulose 5-phosphate reductoisomerase